MGEQAGAVPAGDAFFRSAASAFCARRFWAVPCVADVPRRTKAMEPKAIRKSVNDQMRREGHFDEVGVMMCSFFVNDFEALK